MARLIYRTSDSPAQEDLTTHESDQPRTPNPLARNSSISVSVPASLNIRLVDASVLLEYETWSFITSFLITAFVGFLIATLDAPELSQRPYIAFTAILGILALVSGLRAWYKRVAMAKDTHTVSFGIGEQITEEQPSESGTG